jgi:hypothetical protein
VQGVKSVVFAVFKAIKFSIQIAATYPTLALKNPAT